MDIDLLLEMVPYSIVEEFIDVSISKINAISDRRYYKASSLRERQKVLLKEYNLLEIILNQFEPDFLKQVETPAFSDTKLKILYNIRETILWKIRDNKINCIL